MSYVTQSLFAQSAISRQNAAEMSVIRANQAQQDLIGKNGNLNSIAKKETQIELQKEQAKLQAKIAKTQKDAMKKKHKLYTLA